MSTVKRKKKTNGDTRQSEQLRNWLNKSKNTKCMPPVSFKVFSQLVENLPDIAFQIQVTGSAKPKGTLDECAEWFYNEFYKNSAIREKYEIKVRSCPLAIKNKLLQLPIAEEATTTATGTATEIGVDVAIKNSGRFQFPVSFATFKQYINKQRLINDLLRKKTDQERQLALGDSKKLEDLLRKGYNIFYMFPHRRRLSKYEFKEASPEILELLLKPGVPLDEAAAKTVSESPSSKSRKNKARAIQLQESLTSIVSFDVFEKFIKNIYEIVWQLKLNDLKNEGFDNCAKAYYIAFYLTPEIRERIQYELVPCTSSMRNRLLALPSEADRAILLEMQKISLEIATSQELELNVISPPVEQLQIVDTPEVSYEVQVPYNKDAVESNAMSKDDNPVTFKLFKRYIKNLDGIVSEMLSSDEYKGKTKDECALEYFKAFYTTSQIRKKFKPELKACPSKIRAKLLALPAEEEVIVDVVDIDNDVLNEGNPPKVLTVAQDLPSKQNLVKIKGINYTYPVDIKTFLRYVNYDELKKQLVDAHAKTKKIGDVANEKQLFKRFYYSFYLDKSLRKQFNYNFNAAPAHQRSKFTEMAVAITEKHGEELPQQVANTEPFYTTSQIRKKFKPELKACPSKISAKLLALPAEEEVIIDVVDIDNDVPNEGNPPKVLSVAKDKDNVVDLPSEGNLVKIKGINYSYPVDIKTFLRYVNYDELKKQLVEAHAKTKKIGNETNEKQLFKRFYYSFYLDKSLRKQFNYNFNAAPAHQRSKFTEMAVAIPEKREELPQQVANTEPSTSTHISAQEQPILEPSNCKSNEITCSDCELDVIVDIGKSGRFQFPVSFETFKRCINYDELLHPLLLHVTQQCNEEARMIAKSDPMRCRNVFTRYYRSFYVRPIVRKQYAYRFESVSASLKSKLMQYAVPLNARARKEMNIAATIGAPKACAAVIEEGTTETEVDMEIDEIVEITEINEPNVASFGNEIAIGRKKNSVVAPNEASNASGKISNTQITEEVIILNSEDTNVSLQRTPLMVEASTIVEKTSNASGILRNKTMIDSENTHTFAIGEKAASPRMAVAITEKREEELPQRVANTEPSTSTQICEQKQPILECSDCELDVMEEIVNLGRFIFPVSFETFKRCINYDELLHPLLLHVTQQRHEEARFIAETDPKRCHNVFTQFYRSFYVRPIVRRLYAYRFESVSAELKSKLMKYPVPLNETARRTMNIATVKDVATTGADVIEERTPDEVIFLSSDTDTDTDVSFQSTPLMVETSATVEKTSNAFGILTNKPMIGSENTHTFAIGEKAASTSSGKTNDDLIAENNSELNTKKMHTSSIPACEVEKVKNTPITGTDKSDIVKNTAISGVEIVHESAIVENTATEVVTAIKDNMALSGIEKKMRHHEYAGSPSTTLPVSFKLFKKYITNLDAIVQQMLKCDDHADKTEDECAFQYFTAFYLEPAVREKYEFQIKPCPAKLREKILSIPVIEHESEHGAELQLGVEAEPETNESPAELLDINCNSQQSNDSDPLVVSQRIIITLKNMIYEFPVALQTFKQFINYESLKLELVKTYMKDKPKSNVESILNDEQINLSLLRRFYHSFYIDPRVRKCFKYNFNAAPVEFRPKLLEYAVPLVRVTRPIKTEKIATVEVAQKENELQLAANSTLDLNDIRENNAAFAQVSAQEQRCLSVDLETIANRKDAEVPTSQGAAQSLNMDSMPAKRACDVPKLNVSAVCSTGISPPSTQCSIMSTPETSEQCGSSAAVASPLEKESPLCSLESMAPLVQSGSSEKSKTDYLSLSQASSDAAASEVLQQQLESQLQSPEALSATSEIEDQSSNDSTVIYNDKADRCLADHTYNISWSSGNECESLEDIYADRSNELEILEKQNVMEYIPHNLTYYIAHRTMNLRTRALLEKEFIIDRRPKQKAEELAANAIRSAANPQTIAKSYTTGNKTIPMVVIFPSSTAVAVPLESAAVPATVTLRKANKEIIANIKVEAKYSTEIAEAANNSESNLVDVKEDIVDVDEDIVDVECSTANVANQHQNTFSAPEILEKVGTTKFADRRTEKVTRKVPRSIATVVDNSTEITKDTRTNAVESNKDKVSGIVTATNAKIGSTVVATNETSSTTTTATAGTSEVVVKNESSSKSVTETVPSSTAATSKIVAGNESSSKSVTETLPSSTAATNKRAFLEKDFIIDRRPKQKAEELAANAIRSAANPQTIAKSYTTGNKTIPMVVIFPSSTAVAVPLESAAVPATVTLRKANKEIIANIKVEAKYSTEIAEAANNSESNLVDVKEDIVDVDEDIVDVECSTANVANQHQNTFSAPEILEKVGTTKFADRRTEKVTRKVPRSIATVVVNSTEITKDTRTNAVESNKDKVSGIVTATNAKIGSTVVATNETSSTTTTATAGTSEVVVKNESSSKSVTETVPSSTAATSKIVAGNDSSSKSVTETIPSSRAVTKEVIVASESSSKSVTETIPSSTAATSEVVAGNESSSLPSSTAATNKVVATNESSSKSVTETLPSSTAATNKVVATNVSSSKGVPKTIPSSIATTSDVVTGKELRSKSVPETIPRSTAAISEVADTNESSSKSVTETHASSTTATSKIVAGNDSSSKSVTETIPSSRAVTKEVIVANESSSKSVTETIPSSTAATSEVAGNESSSLPSSTAATNKVVGTNESSSKSVTETLASSTAGTNELVSGNKSSSKTVTETIPSSRAVTSEVVAGNESSSKSVKSVTETHTSSTAGTSELVSGNKSSLKSVTETIPSSRAATKEVVAASESSSKSVTETIPSSTAATSEVVSTNESSSKSVPKTLPSSTATSSKVEVNKASYTSATKALETVSEATKATAPQAIASTDAARETSKKESNRAVAKPTEETTDAPTTFNLNSIDFFAPIGKEHNLKYLIYTSHGMKQTVWCILSQLTCSEFKKYTCIHNGESFYKDESLFSRVYSHVIHEGNWPINLFVKLSMLIELLRNKDVQIGELDLAHLSPKVLHSSELMRYTNFDDIAERNYRNRTGDRVNNLVDLFSEVENFYVECWMQDQWIQQVPRVTSQELKLANAKIEPVALNIPECRIPICLLEKVPEAVIEIESETIELSDNSPQDILQEPDCPATQLEQSIAGNSLFVDVEDVVPATQLPEAQSDPLMETSIEMPTVQIKQEPVKLLSNMRFTIDSSQSQEVVCESISPEEQIINLDEDDERIAAELSCFAIVPPKDRSPPLSFLNANLSKCEFDDLMKDVSLSPELQLQITNQLMSLESSQIEVATSPTEESQVPVADVPPAATAVAAPASPVRSVTIRKPSRAFKSTLPSKRPRLMADNVPQLRHDFRPLPFTAAVPNQAAVNPSAQQELPTTSSSQVQSQSQQDSSDPPMTASQELATDNTLMASSQLQHLLDAPHVNVRQVNELPMAVECVSDKNDRASLSMPQAVLHQQIVFSTLQRFLYFESLTTSQIAKYQINSLSVGSLHQQALISVNGQLFNVNGPLLEHLFPHLTRSLLQDLQHLLNNVGEFNYNCRLNLHQDTKEDLRLRVLYAFMRASPPFTHIRLQFENATREWATFSATNERDRDLLRRKPKCDVRANLKPEILQRMKEVKSLCYF